MPSTRRHVFISHHSSDDKDVARLTDMLRRNGWDARNSSLRLRSENKERWEQRRIPERTLKRLLRMRISWARTFIVLIGQGTHSRPWVDWEIREAAHQGKRIVGVFTRGGTENDIPPAFERYGNALENWSSNSIMRSVDGPENTFKNPDGSERTSRFDPNRVTC
jgi:hypothetical protein